MSKKKSTTLPDWFRLENYDSIESIEDWYLALSARKSLDWFGEERDLEDSTAETLHRFELIANSMGSDEGSLPMPPLNKDGRLPVSPMNQFECCLL